ncbi:putative 6-phospho-beta-glucosidase [compost metagenome]
MHALTQQVKAYERLTIEAAVHGDRRSGLLALVTNPLVANAQIAQPLLEEVLEVNKAYLPQFNA